MEKSSCFVNLGLIRGAYILYINCIWVLVGIFRFILLVSIFTSASFFLFSPQTMSLCIDQMTCTKVLFIRRNFTKIKNCLIFYSCCLYMKKENPLWAAGLMCLDR